MESAELIAAATVTVQSAPVTVSVFIEKRITATLVAGAAGQSLALSFVYSFFAILLATGLVACLNYFFLKQDRQYKTADLFCVNMERYVNDYFEAANEKERLKCAVKCNIHVQGLLDFITTKNKPVGEFYPHIRKLTNIDDNSYESDDVRMRNALSAVVQIKSILTRW